MNRHSNPLAPLTILMLMMVSPLRGENLPAVDLPACLKQSIEAARTLPYEGILAFRRRLEGNDLNVTLKVCHSSPDEKKMEILSPETLHGVLVVQSQKALWMTPLEDQTLNEEQKKNRENDARSLRWFRVLRDDTATIGLEDISLVVQNYILATTQTVSVANRKALEIHITPKPNNRPANSRPSLRIWVDEETKLPLKYERFDYNGHLEEKLEFQEITTGSTGAPCVLSTDGLEKIFSMADAEADQQEIQLDFVPLKPSRLPQGFQEKFSFRWKGHEGVTMHTLYTDGLARVSTFQRKQTDAEKAKQEQEPAESRDKVKKPNWANREAFIRELNGVHVFAVGDIPERGILRLLYNLEPSATPPPPGNPAPNPQNK